MREQVVPGTSPAQHSEAGRPGRGHEEFPTTEFPQRLRTEGQQGRAPDQRLEAQNAGARSASSDPPAAKPRRTAELGRVQHRGAGRSGCGRAGTRLRDGGRRCRRLALLPRDGRCTVDLAASPRRTAPGSRCWWSGWRPPPNAAARWRSRRPTQCARSRASRTSSRCCSVSRRLSRRRFVGASAPRIARTVLRAPSGGSSTSRILQWIVQELLRRVAVMHEIETTLQEGVLTSRKGRRPWRASRRGQQPGRGRARWRERAPARGCRAVPEQRFGQSIDDRRGQVAHVDGPSSGTSGTARGGDPRRTSA